MARPIYRHARALVILLSAIAASVCPGFARAASAAGGLAWSTDSTGPRRLISVHGRRAAIFGYPESGLEVWVYPFQIVSGLRIRFRPQGATTAMDGQALLRRVIYSPESVTRIYAGPDFIVREKLFVPLDEPGAIATYQVNSASPVDIEVRFTPVLDLMWPASIGGQEAVWNSAASAYLLSEPTRRFAASIGSPDIVSHDDTPNSSLNLSGLAFALRAGGARNTAQFVIAASATDAAALAGRLREQYASLEKEAADHYSGLVRESLQIETPDAAVNRALAWAEIALDQAWVCNPDLGCGLIAGYGPSRKARRPQYDWFFAGDGMVALHALLATGQHARARQELEFILKYQDQKSGMIWHELSQSAAWLDWDKYPYKFLHVDLTFQFLETVARYVSVTGDRDFANQHWPAIQAAYHYCSSLLDANDGLPRIPSEKRAAREQEELGDELSLSASWVAASEAFADLAAGSGHDAAAGQARLAGQKAASAIGRRYWDEQRHFWITGYTRSGTALVDDNLGPVGALETSSFSSAQRTSLLDRFASSDFQADWGTRGKASSSATYAPNSYAGGSVWAIATAGVARAFWDEHRPASALPIWSALVPWSSLDSLGHMHETLAGDYYHEEVESVPEQTWSSASFLTSFVKGLMGLQVDGAARRVVLAPHLPADWNAVTLRNLRVGSSEIALSVSQSPSELRLQAQNNGPPVKMLLAPEIPFGAQLREARLGNRAIHATLEEHGQDSHARTEFELPHGAVSVTLSYRGGIAIVPDPPRLFIGESSHAIKVTGVHRDGRKYTIDFDYVPAESPGFSIRTPWRIQNTRGAEVEAISPTLYRFTIPAKNTAPSPSNRHGRVVVTFAAGG